MGLLCGCQEIAQKPCPSRLSSHHSALCATRIKRAKAHVPRTMASPLQSHKVTLQRKLQERQGDLQSKQQLLAAVEKVGACSALIDSHSAACGLSTQ